jgi:hypothetical protein
LNQKQGVTFGNVFYTGLKLHCDSDHCIVYNYFFVLFPDIKKRMEMQKQRGTGKDDDKLNRQR